MASWIDQELAECEFADARLEKRFKRFVEQLAEGIGETIPMACQEWANTKAAYRFLSNQRVSEDDILAGHFHSSRNRFRATDGLALVLHDTTEFVFKRDKPELIGRTTVTSGGKDKAGRRTPVTVCGILMHSSLVVTAEGIAVGDGRREVLDTKGIQGNQCP